MNSDNHYQLLQIDPTATTAEIEQALRDQRRRWMKVQSHPVLERRQEAELKVRALAEAEATLTDPQTRAAYDDVLFPAQTTPAIPPAPTTTSWVPVPPPSAEAPTPPATSGPGETGSTGQTGTIADVMSWIRANKVSSAVVGGGIALALVVTIAVSAGNRAEQPAADDSASSDSFDAGGTDEDASVASSIPSVTPTPVITSLPVGYNAQLRDGALYLDTTPFVIPSGEGVIDPTSLQSGGTTARVLDVAQAAGDGSNPRLAAVVEITQPAVDLTPATVERRLVFTGPDLHSLTTQVPIATSQGEYYDGPSTRLHGSAGGTVVLTVTDDDDSFDSTNVSRGYDALTGSQLWERGGLVEGTVGGIALMNSLASAETSGFGFECRSVHGVDLVSGNDVWAVDTAWFEVTKQNCRSVSIDGAPIGGRYLAIELGDGFVMLDAQSGARLTWRDEYADRGLVDPVSGLVFSPQTDETPASIYDPTTGADVFTIPADQATSLGLSVSAFFDGRLYASTTDEDLVLDATTGTTISRGWSTHPVSVIGDWWLFDDGTLLPAGS